LFTLLSIAVGSPRAVDGTFLFMVTALEGALPCADVKGPPMLPDLVILFFLLVCEARSAAV